MKAKLPALGLLVGLLGGGGVEAAGLAVDGRERVRLLAPSGVEVTGYANAGYRMEVEGGEAKVEVDTSPLGSDWPFSPPSMRRPDPVSRLAGSVTRGATRRYHAVTRVLSWVARHVRYELDRSLAQDAEAVLARRSGYCTGVARLTVALLGAVGIEAREVAGYVVEPAGPGPPGFHRWIEVLYPDRGWVFSDPLATHHYVPASYLRLADEEVAAAVGARPGRLLERGGRLEAVDVYPAGLAGVTARRNSPRRLAAALRVELAGAGDGTVVLEGATARRRRPLVAGRTTFAGLEPGSYTLRLSGVPTAAPLERRVELPGRIHAVVELAPPPAIATAAGRAREAEPTRRSP